MATRHNLQIRAIRSDNGSEFKNRKVREWTARKHIELEYSPVYTPELNGVAERMMRTLMNTTRAKLFHAKLPKSFWSSAILSSAYVRNLIGPQGLQRTPHELFYGVRPDYSALRIYGSPAFVHIDQRANLTDHERGDLDWRAFPAIFIGYMTRTVLRGCSGTSRRAKFAQLLTSMRRFSNSIMMSLRSTSSTRQFRQTAAIRMAPHIEPRSHTMCTRDSMHFTITQTQRCCWTIWPLLETMISSLQSSRNSSVTLKPVFR